MGMSAAGVAVIGEASVEAVARWYVVQTQPHAETKAIFHLERQRYRIFCPRVTKMVRHARKSSRVLAPLFPGYLFLNLDVFREGWRSVNGTFGVSHIIMQNELPQPVPRGVVEELQARMDARGVILWQERFKVGQTVKIGEGPFADFIGILEHLDAKGRVRVLLDLMGRTVSVTTSADKLVVAA